MVTRAKRRDANEQPIVDALIAAGAFVQKLDGAGVPDLLVSYLGVLTLLEVKLSLGAKGGTKHHRDGAGGKGDMTAAQVKWWREWKGKPPVVVRNADEALHAVGLSRES